MRACVCLLVLLCWPGAIAGKEKSSAPVPLKDMLRPNPESIDEPWLFDASKHIPKIINYIVKFDLSNRERIYSVFDMFSGVKRVASAYGEAWNGENKQHMNKKSL
eukprot:89213-Karenia_brevis.AAC.1